eukprot:1724688-Rhodomonas_salina.1
MKSELASRLEPRGIVVEGVLLKALKFPPLRPSTLHHPSSALLNPCPCSPSFFRPSTLPPLPLRSLRRPSNRLPSLSGPSTDPIHFPCSLSRP